MKIKDKKDFAISQLKQVAHINVALKCSQKNICKTLKFISARPNNITFPENPALNFEEFRMSSNETPELFTENGFGHYANRMVIVYVASIVENFIFETGSHLNLGKVEQNMTLAIKRFFKGMFNKDVGFFKSFCRFLKEKDMKEKELPVSFGKLSKMFKEKDINLKGLEGYEQCKLLTDIRHKIVHTKGKIDDKFLKDINKINCPEAAILKKLKTGDPVNIPLDTVILPCLLKSILFLDEFYNIIKTMDH